MEIERIDINDSEEKQFWFRDLVQTAYDNGWTYSSCTPEMWKEYVERWNHFVEYLKYMRVNREQQIVKILIGEAPPFYRATKERCDRAYFYSPEETGFSPWFSSPLIHFVGKKKIKSKRNKLEALAKKRVLLLDVFPFPIIQDTEMRMDITGKFAKHLQTYFLDYVKSVIVYLELETEKIEWGVAATKYAGTQLMLGENSRCVLGNGIIDFFKSPITEKITFKSVLKFHDDSKLPMVICKDSLNLSIWSSSKKKKVLSPYFVFVVTLLNAKEWLEYVKDAKNRKESFTSHDFTKQLLDNKLEDFLRELNRELSEKKMLPIFSTASGGISFNEKAFFNSHEVLLPKKKSMKKKAKKEI
jgi:hypothetical protein